MRLSIIVPCYNESKEIKHKIEDITIPFLKEHSIDYEIILVNDGSKDNTKEVLESIKDVIATGYDINRGKGGAVKFGIENATGDYILFMDADLSTDLNAIPMFLNHLNDADILIASRHLKDSILPIKSPWYRKVMSWSCHKFVCLLFGFRYKDTQCGFKLFKAEVAKKIIEKQLVCNFAFDVEYLYIAKLNKYSVKELPVTWRDDRGSTVSPIKSSLKFIKDGFKIKRNKKKYIF